VCHKLSSANNFVYRLDLDTITFVFAQMIHNLTCFDLGETPVACFLFATSVTGTGCGGTGTFETLGVAWAELPA
jgi:hypothetical protein